MKTKQDIIKEFREKTLGTHNSSILCNIAETFWLTEIAQILDELTAEEMETIEGKGRPLSSEEIEYNEKVEGHNTYRNKIVEYKKRLKL